MKRQLFSFRGVLTVGAIALAAVLMSSCNKNSGEQTPIPSAGLMTFNLAPDRSAVDIALSGNLATASPMAYTNYNGFYQNIYVGSRDVESYDRNADSTVARSTFNFEDKKYYSLFVVGNNGVYKNIVVKDDVDSLPADKAYIRYINAIPDSSLPVVSITANGSVVASDPASFTSVSGFTATPGGDVTIAVSNSGNISATRTITLESGKVYTALLIGIPGETDTAKAVQIKYILNGSLPSASGQ